MALASPDRSFSDHPEYYSAVSDVTVLDGSAQGGRPKSKTMPIQRLQGSWLRILMIPSTKVSIVTVWMNDAPAARMFGTHPKVLASHVAYGELVDAATNVSPENVLVCVAPMARAPCKILSPDSYFRLTFPLRSQTGTRKTCMSTLDLLGTQILTGMWPYN